MKPAVQATNTLRAGGTEDSAVPDTFDYTPASIIPYTTPNAFTSTFHTDCGDTDFTQLHNELDSISIPATVEKGGFFLSAYIVCCMDFSTVDAKTPGTTVIGNISIPAGATLLEGLENTVFISVQVTAPLLTVTPAAIPLTSFDEPDRTDAVAFPVEPRELSTWFADSIAGFIGYDAEGNPYDLISGAWSLDTVDTLTAGVYYAFTSPDLRQNILWQTVFLCFPTALRSFHSSSR